MRLSFLTPSAAIVAFAVLIPLAACVLSERRVQRVRDALRLPPPTRRVRVPLLLALFATTALLGLAAAQPVAAVSRTRDVRSGAEVFFLFDTSRSMLAAAGPREPTRFQRARTLALEVRDGLPGVRVGIASFIDRVLPHLFPTTDRAAFTATLDRALGIERPPPQRTAGARITSLYAIAAMALQNFYSPEVRRRLLVVVTDGESDSFADDELRVDLRRAGIATIFVHVWQPAENVYFDGRAATDYEPDPASGAALRHLASRLGGRVFQEDDVAGIEAAARRALDTRHGSVPSRNVERTPLAPWAVGAAFLPLGFLLWRRNLR